MITRYDFIICGGGLSGLMLARGIIREKSLINKTILIVEREDKNTNDRTWCFWENKGFEDWDLVHKTWQKGFYISKNFKKSIDFSSNSYSYKMIRSIDFYASYKAEIISNPNVQWLKSKVESINQDIDRAEVVTQSGTFWSQVVFSSIVTPEVLHRAQNHPYLLQHFLGWYVETTNKCFDSKSMVLMDFSVDQGENTRFMYVLPLSESKALVEYTLFSKSWLPQKEYTKAIDSYLKNLNSGPYKIIETEKNAIPMTTYPFYKNNRKRIIHIGMAGGWAKPSSGFTFYRSIKFIDEILLCLKSNSLPSNKMVKSRFLFYDRMLLKVLEKNNRLGRVIFDDLFRNNGPIIVLKFLSQETTFFQELKILSSFSNEMKWLFFKALFR